MEKNIEYVPVFYKAKWVLVPLPYLPESSVNSEGEIQLYKFIPIDGGEPLLIKPKLKRCTKLAYERIFDSAKTILDVENLPDKALTAISVKNEIPLGWMTRRFVRQVKTKTNLKPTRRIKRKFTPLTAKDFRKLIKEMSKICKLKALFAQILWYFNQQLCRGDSYITGEELLRLKIDDVEPEDGVTTCISLSRSSAYGTQMASLWLPVRIWKQLCEAIRPDCLYVFSNARGSPLSIRNINQAFRLAGERAGIEDVVTTLSLRPISKKTKKYLSPDLVYHTPENIHEISTEEWKDICDRHPDIIEKRGRRSNYDPRDIFNAILYHFRTKIPFRELSYVISWKAIHSQYRRWKTKGIIDSVLDWRDDYRPK